MGFLSERGKQATESTGQLFFNANKIPLGKSARIRILSAAPMEGFQIWGQTASGDRKAFRFAECPTAEAIDRAFGTEYLLGLNSFTNKPDEVDFYVAVAVYDYATEAVKVWQITQKTLMRGIEDIAEQEEYDPIQNWDLNIKREEKSYAVMPVPPKKEAEKDVLAAWAAAQKDGFDLAKILQVAT
jgi:hypothetical protein